MSQGASIRLADRGAPTLKLWIAHVPHAAMLAGTGHRSGPAGPADGKNRGTQRRRS